MKENYELKDVNELLTIVNTLRDEIFKAKLETRQGHAKDTSVIRAKRREIARVKTALTKKAGV